MTPRQKIIHICLHNLSIYTIFNPVLYSLKTHATP
jgi:hypothetical protein